MAYTLKHPGVDALAAMVAEGLSDSEIGQRVGASKSAVHRWRTDAGLKPAFAAGEGWKKSRLKRNRKPTPPRLIASAEPATPPPADDVPAADPLISRDEARRLARLAMVGFRKHCERRRMLRQFERGY